MEVLKVYKVGSSEFAEITQATLGGFTDLTRTKVRNEPGGLTIQLAATTIAMLHSWIDEAAWLELWVDGEFNSAFVVDKYTPRWGSLTATVECVGLLIYGKSARITADFETATVSLSVALHACVSQVPEWTWNATYVSVDGALAAGNYTDESVLTVLQNLAEATGATFWIDDFEAGMFCAELVSNVTATEHQLRTAEYPDGDIVEFETTYTAAGIVNRLLIKLSSETSWTTYDDVPSQTLYGIRGEKVILEGGNKSQYASGLFAQRAIPRREMKLEVVHDAARRPGMKLTVLGLSDGRTYEDVIQQVSWTFGDRTDEVLSGYMPPIIMARSPSSGTSVPSSGGGTDAPTEADVRQTVLDVLDSSAGSYVDSYLTGLPGGSDPNTVFTADAAGSRVWAGSGSVGGGGLTRGVITAYDSTTHACTFAPDAGGSWTGVAVAAHITAVTLGVPCWVGGSGG